MPDLVASSYSEQDALNTSPSPAGVQGGYAPSTIGPIIRAHMGATKRAFVQANALVTSTGAANAYLLTYGQAPAAPGYNKGIVIRFYAHADNTGAATLNINSLGAKSILSRHGVALTAGQIKANQLIELAYNGTSFVLITSEIQDTKFTGNTSFANIAANVALLTALTANSFTVNAASGINFGGGDDTFTFNDTTNVFQLTADAVANGAVTTLAVGGVSGNTVSRGQLLITQTAAEAIKITTPTGDVTSDPYISFWKDVRQGYIQHQDGSAVGAGFRLVNDVTGEILSINNVAGNSSLRFTTGSVAQPVWHGGNMGAGSTLDADLLDGQQGAYYLPATSYNAADVLTKIKTVDGVGSGLDADLFDGLDSSAFLKNTGNFTTTGNLTINNMSPSIVFNESDATPVWRLQANGGRFYVLEDTAGDGTYETPYPLEMVRAGSIGNLWGQKIWTAGNHGSGSGLDAGLLEGQNAAFFRNAGNMNAGILPNARISGSYDGIDYLTTNRVRALATNDVSEVSTAHAFQIGADSGLNVRMDTNEFLIVRDGALATDAYYMNSLGSIDMNFPLGIRLNSATGGVSVAGNMNVTGNGKFTGTAPQIQFIDTTTGEYSARLRVDGNNFYFDSSTDDINFGEVFRFELDTKIGYVNNSRIWTDSYATAAVINGKIGYTPANAGSGILAGSGLTGGGTLAATRTITLGTPGTITNSTTNSATGNTHTHEITMTAADVGAVPVARTVTAGNGLTGGGALSANQVITMGTPGSITNSTTNSVTTTSHTHALATTFAEVYTGSGANDVSFPLGHTVSVYTNGAAVNRNTLVAPGLGSGDTRFYRVMGTGQGVTALTGTWRSRGQVGDDYVIVERVS